MNIQVIHVDSPNTQTATQGMLPLVQRPQVGEDYGDSPGSLHD